MNNFFRIAALALLAAVLPACGGAGDTFVVQQGPVPGNGTGAGGTATGFGGAVQPDIVFRNDRNIDGILELFSADAAGTVLVNLSGPLTTGGQVLSHSWSPDRQWVAFIADKDVATRKELYVVRAIGGTPVKVCGDLFPGRDVEFMAWAPDSSRIAYLADDAVDDHTELFSVRPDGTGRTKLSGTLVAGGFLESFCAWAPDSSRIAFTGLADSLALNQLYTVVPDGSAGRIAVSPLDVIPQGSAPYPYRWAPDSSRIAYLGWSGAAYELHTTLPTGPGGNVKVSGTPAPGAGAPGEFAWSPDSSMLAYRGPLDTNGVVELYTTLPTGSGSVKKISTISAVQDVMTLEWSPANNRIAYLVFNGSQLDLHTADPTVAASGALAVNLCIFHRYSPSGATLGFIAQGSDVRSLFVASPEGLAGMEISPAGCVLSTEFAWSPSGGKIAYNAVTAGHAAVFTVDPAGTNSVQVTAGLVTIPASSLGTPVWRKDGSGVAFYGDGEVDGINCMYASTVAGPAVRVSGPMFEFANVQPGFEVR